MAKIFRIRQKRSGLVDQVLPLVTLGTTTTTTTPPPLGFGPATFSKTLSSLTLSALARLKITATLAKTLSSLTLSTTAGTGLSAPTVGYPSPINSNPTTIQVHLGPDWATGDILKLARSASPSMSSPIVLSHTLTDADVTAILSGSSLSLGLSGITLAGVTYFQAYGNHGIDSPNKSGITAWGDTTIPVITTSATQSVYETVPLAITLTATDTGGVPALVSDGTSPGWYISGGTDRLQFQVAIIAGVPTLQWYNNGTESYTFPANIPPNNANPYNVQVTAVDYSGNQSTALSEAVTVNPVTVTPFTFTTVDNAPLSTTETSNTVTLTIAPTGLDIAASISGAGFTYSKNGGAYQSGSFVIRHGDTLTLRVTSPAANNLSESCTVTVGSYSTTWTVNTPVTTTSFNPSDKSGNIVLTNTNLTAQNTSGGSGPNPVRTLNSYSTGKHAVQFRVDKARGWYGIEDGTQVLNNFPTSSFCLAHDGSVFVGTGSASSLSAPADTDTIIIAWDADAHKGWLKKNSTWHTTCGDPNAGGVGFDISGMASTLYVFFLGFDNLSQATLQAVTLTGFTSVI